MLCVLLVFFFSSSVRKNTTWLDDVMLMRYTWATIIFEEHPERPIVFYHPFFFSRLVLPFFFLLLLFSGMSTSMCLFIYFCWRFSDSYSYLRGRYTSVRRRPRRVFVYTFLKSAGVRRCTFTMFQCLLHMDMDTIGINDDTTRERVFTNKRKEGTFTLNTRREYAIHIF